MKTYLLIYTHKHGTDELLYKSNKDLTGWYHEEELEEGDVETLKPVLDILSIDFEPEIGETLDIKEFGLEDIPVIKF